jgi:hypothetical protein
LGKRIRDYIKEADTPIFTLQISRNELKMFKILGNKLGYYPQLLIGMKLMIRYEFINGEK